MSIFAVTDRIAEAIAQGFSGRDVEIKYIRKRLSAQILDC